MSRPSKLFGMAALLVLGGATATACGSSSDGDTSPGASDSGVQDSGGGAPDGSAPADSGTADTGTVAITVAGKVVDVAGVGIAGIPVSVNGGAAVTTDASGTFTAANVTAPYTASMFISGAKTVIAYEGLTRPDPALPVIFAQLPTKSAAVSGTLSGGIGYPEGPNTTTLVQLSAPGLVNPPVGNDNAGSFQVGGGQFDTAPSVTGTVYALQYNFATGSIRPTAYTGFGSVAGVTAADGVVKAVGAINLVASAQTTPSKTFTATINAPANYAINGERPTLFIGGLPALNLPNTSITSTFTYPLPNLTGATLQLTVSASNSVDSSSSSSTKSGLALDSTTTTIGLLPAVTTALPASGATGVTTATDFSWSQFPGGIHALAVSPPSSGGISYLVVTAATHAHIPDGTALGVAFPKATNCTWGVVGLAPFASADTFVDPAFSFVNAPELYETITKLIPFTTSP